MQHKIIQTDYDCATPQVSRVSVSNIMTRHLYLYYIILISWILYVHMPQSSSHIKIISHTFRVTSTICTIPTTLGIISNIFQDSNEYTSIVWLYKIYNYNIMSGIFLQSNIYMTYNHSKKLFRTRQCCSSVVYPVLPGQSSKLFYYIYGEWWSPMFYP